MSLISKTAPKHCAEKGFKINYKKLFTIISTLISSFLLLILLVWLILHPTKPKFSLQQTNIYQLNLSNTNLLNSSIQTTILSQNPNSKIAIYYDNLQVYATYKNQQITNASSIPSFYQGHEDSNLITAFLVGTGLPVAPSFVYEIGRDQLVGKMIISVKMNVRIRWKVGSWVSGRYRLNVKCVAVMEFGPSIPSSPLSSKLPTQCSTSI